MGSFIWNKWGIQILRIPMATNHFPPFEQLLQIHVYKIHFRLISEYDLKHVSILCDNIFII